MDDDGAYIQHKGIKRKVKLHKQANVLVMRMQIVPPSLGSWVPPGLGSWVDARVLGVLGSARQEG